MQGLPGQGAKRRRADVDVGTARCGVGYHEQQAADERAVANRQVRRHTAGATEDLRILG